MARTEMERMTRNSSCHPVSSLSEKKTSEAFNLRMCENNLGQWEND